MVTPSYAQQTRSCYPNCITTTGQNNGVDPSNYSRSNDPPTQEQGNPSIGIQGTVVEGLLNATGFFSSMGELAVRDATTRAQTTIAAIKTTAMLVDMLKQAIGGHAPGNDSTGQLVWEQAQYSTNPLNILYGRYTPENWITIYRENEPYRNGEWLTEYNVRQHARLTTQMDLMELLKMRQDAFGADDSRISDINAAIDECVGRNCLLQTSAKAQLEAAAQSLSTQQISMVIANSLIAGEGGRINEATHAKAQEQLFISNMDRELPWPEFIDRGL